MTQIRSDHEPGERYLILRVISVLFIGIGAILLFVGTLLLAFGLYSSLTGRTVELSSGRAPLGSPPVGLASYLNLLRPFAILWALVHFSGGLQSLAMGYLIRLAIQVEENTRTSARCLERLSSRAEPRAESPGPLFVS